MGHHYGVGEKTVERKQPSGSNELSDSSARRISGRAAEPIRKNIGEHQTGGVEVAGWLAVQDQVGH